MLIIMVFTAAIPSTGLCETKVAPDQNKDKFVTIDFQNVDILTSVPVSITLVGFILER